jgi:hypothetical protein
VELRVCAGLLIACAGTTTGCRTRAAPAILFDCRVSNPPAQVSAGPTRATVSASRLTSASQLLQLESGRRYVFVVPRSRELLLSQTKEATWFDHAAIARCEPVLTAGGVTAIHDGRRVEKVVLDAESAVYCPTTDSLREAMALVERLASRRIAFALKTARSPASTARVAGLPRSRAARATMAT